MTPHSIGGGESPAGQVSVDAGALAARAAKVTSPEFVITETMRAGETVAAVFGRVAEQLTATRAEVISAMVYGSINAREEIDRAMAEAMGEIAWPVTWVQGASCDGLPLSGVQVFAISGVTLTRVRLGSRVAATVFEHGDVRHCFVGGMGPNSTALRAPAQVQQMFGNLECALDRAGFALADVVRTWFYNEDILSWYDEFNRVRSAHYATVPWRTGSIPASTAVEGKNPAGAALTLAAWAVQPLDGRPCAQEIASPLQCPAPRYGSSFARAMEVVSGGYRRLLISGTASIYPDGRTAHLGNAKKQVDLAMEVIAAILQSRGMTFHDVTRASAYFQHPVFKGYFDAWCAERHLREMPVVPMHCDICRDDLLFELELDACVRG